MRGRDRQTMLRLEKISETSSPSPKQKHKTDELTNSRVNPLSLSTATNPKAIHKMHEHSETDSIPRLQEEIMDRKQRLDLWEDAYTKRHSQANSTAKLAFLLSKGIASMSSQRQIRLSLLRALRKGKRFVLQWFLVWLRQLFQLIRTTLTLTRTFYP